MTRTIGPWADDDYAVAVSKWVFLIRLEPKSNVDEFVSSHSHLSFSRLKSECLEASFQEYLNRKKTSPDTQIRRTEHVEVEDRLQEP
jgi:hypothetical protein